MNTVYPPQSQYAGLQLKQLQAVALAADDVYKPDRDTLFATKRTVRRFWPVGDLIACTRVDQETDTVIVAIRGTSEIGNWIFTNFQAFYTKLQVIDDSLKTDGVVFQAGILKNPIAGSMHQGFIRAFSWLWYGSEPVLGRVDSSARIAIHQLIKYLVIFLSPLAIWKAACALDWMTLDLGTAATLSILISFLIVCLESGVIEGLFVRPVPPSGTNLGSLKAELNSHRSVVFTGHSLGGAIASVCFAIYRTWCLSDSSRRDNAHLVTFGSARLGDETFIRSFEHKHGNRLVHFEHPGDPVPQVPPNGLRELLYRKYPIRGFGGLLISVAFLPWTVYKYVYRVSRPARWSPEYVNNMRQSPTRRLCISFHSMSNVYLPFVLSLGRVWRQ